MPCNKPLNAYEVPSAKANGKKTIVFNPPHTGGNPIQLPCGQCTACRLERSRQWAARCYHESTLHKENCFVTLTYSDEHLPEGNSINRRDYQLFLKKLRKRHPERSIRFFLCGEYGEISQRPHYHICLFNYDFKDKMLYRDGEHPLYMSEELDNLWNKGLSTIGELNFKTAAYTARYVMKKVTGPAAEKHYNGRMPEFVSMSLKPGIGKKWYDKYKHDVYPTDNMVINGAPSKPPKYYDYLHEQLEPEEFIQIKENREQQKGLKPVEEYLDKRLVTKERVANSKYKFFNRRSI